MDFRTIIDIKKHEPGITYSDRIMMFGSCFTENIGKKLQNFKFQTLVNPFGILYNPESVRNSINRIFDRKIFSEKDIFEQEGVWNSFSHHSRFADLSAKNFLNNANKRLKEASEFLKKTDYLIITFGTAWIYRLIESGQIVSNCHKLPGRLFTREKLSPEAIYTVYAGLIEKLISVHPGLKIIFTVSPIRHWKDGAHENQLSKATLLLAIEQLQTRFPDQVSYFPAYEIMMDELRDYRFYASDMIHPSETAIDYIWERFSGCYFSTGTTAQMKEIGKLVAASRHRPFNAGSPASKDFIQQNIKLLELLEKKYPHLDFSEERIFFEK